MTTQTDQPSLLDQLLAQRQQAQQTAESEREAARKGILRETIELINLRLGPLAAEFAPYVQQPYFVDWKPDHRGERLGCLSLGIDTPQLDFWIIAYDNGSEVRLSHSNNAYRDNNKPIFKSHDDPIVLDFFAQRLAVRQKAVAEQQEREEQARQKHIDSLASGLKPVYSTWNGYARNPEEAQAKLAELNQLAPERAGEWQEAFEAWGAYRLKVDAEAAEHRLKQQAERENTNRFRQAFVAYQQAHARQLQQNIEALEALAAQYDQTFTVWRLEYALVAADEEGETYVETKYAFVLAPEPDSFGGWTVLAGRPEKRFFYHLVSRSDAITCQVSEGQPAPYIRVEAAGDYHFYYSPVYSREEIEAAVYQAVAALPFEPQPEHFDLGHLYGQDRRELYYNLHLVENGQDAAQVEGEEEPAF